MQHLPQQLCYINRSDYYRPGLGVTRHAVLPLSGRKRIVDLGGSPRITGRLVIDGKPLADTNVLLAGAGSSHFGPFKLYGRTDQAGAFTFQGVPAGERGIYYRTIGSQDEWTSAAVVQMGRSDLDMGAIPSVTGQIVAHIKGAESKTLNVNLKQPRAGGGLSEKSAGHLTPPSSPGEPYVFENVPPGDYDLFVSAASTSISRTPVALKAGEKSVTVKLQIPSGQAAIEGQLAPEISGPNAKTMLVLWNAKTGHGATIDVNKPGSYRIEGLPAGHYELTNQLGFMSGGPALTQVVLEEGKTTKLDIDATVCKPTLAGMEGMAQVLAVNENGIPIPGVELWLEGPRGRMNPTLTSDHWVLFNGPPGEYELHARYGGYHEASRRLSLRQLAIQDLQNSRSLELIELEPAR